MPKAKHVCNIFSKTSIVIIIILLLIIFGLSLHIYTLTGIRLIPYLSGKKTCEIGEISQIVDIRTKTEYDLGHYPDSIHIPADKINKDTVKVLDKNQPTSIL